MSQGLEIGLWLAGFLVALICYGIATDPTHRKTAKAKRIELCEDFIDRLDKGGPR